MLMADNSYCDVNPPVDDILLRDVNDDDEQDRLYFDMDSLWNMIGDTPENKPDDYAVNIASQGMPELEGSSSIGVDELPRFDTCSYSYCSETSDPCIGISEGSFDTASRSGVVDCAKQQYSTLNASPVNSISGSPVDWISLKVPYFSQDSLSEIAGTHDKLTNAARDTYTGSDMGGALYQNGFRRLESSSDSKGPAYNPLMEKSDISDGPNSGMGESNSHSIEAPHAEKSTMIVGLFSQSASCTQSSNHELHDIDFLDSGSPQITEFHAQCAVSSGSLSDNSSEQQLTENLGIQSFLTNGFESTSSSGETEVNLETPCGDVLTDMVMKKVDISRMNNDQKSRDWMISRCEKSSTNANWGLIMADKASSTQIFPQTRSKMSIRKLAVCVKDERDKAILTMQGTKQQSYVDPDGIVSRESCNGGNLLASKKQASPVKDEESDELFTSHGAASRCFIDVDDLDDVGNRKSPGVVADELFADKGFRQSVSDILTSMASKRQVVAKNEINDISLASNKSHQSICKGETWNFLGPAGDSHCLDMQASFGSWMHSYDSVRRQFVSDSSVVSSGSLVHRAHIDDDSDSEICIVEDLSVPTRQNQFTPDTKSHIASQSLPCIDSCNNFGVGGMRLKANDESSIFRAALQDMSQPKSEATPPDGFLAVPLLKHQRIALSWMIQKETSNLHCSGGILADDQGLGKTISTIALILTERSKSTSVCTINNEQMETLDIDDYDSVTELNEPKIGGLSCQVTANISLTKARNPLVQETAKPAAGTLIVCPTSVLRQWSEEMHNKVTKEANLSVLTYHGSNRMKDPVALAKYDVVLTTYAIVSMEVPKQPLADADNDETETQIGSPPMGHSFTKKRKYPPTSSKRSTKNKKSERELLESVSGPLSQVRWFRVVLDEAQSIKNHRTQAARACWSLRAKRRWCLSGTPIQNSIDDLYSYFRFLKYDPYAVHKSFCSMIKVPIQRNQKDGYKKLQAVLKTILLRRTKGTILDGEPIIKLPPKTIELKRLDFTMEERNSYNALEAEYKVVFAEYAAAGTVKENYVNILLMLLRLRQACNHPFLVSASGSKSMKTCSVEMAKKLAPEKRVSLLNCLEGSLAICSICKDPPEDAVVAICGHVFCNQCICEYLTGDDNQCATANCKARLRVTSIFSRDALRGSISEGQEIVPDCSGSAETLRPCSLGRSYDSSKIKAVIEVLCSLSRPLSADGGTDAPRDGWPRDVNNKQSLDLNSDPNSEACVVGEKAIVFSQWTSMLDLLEPRLKKSSINYRRLDGTMPISVRDKAVKDFNTQPEVSVIIMSLKAASLGLNMVAACHVILLDLWWNPTTEDQAIDRAHRIGQTRPVSVLRFAVKDTVEDRILALQQKKREMVASAFGEDGSGGHQTRLTVKDLEYLFGYNL